MAATDLKIEHVGALARTLKCEGMIVIAIDKVTSDRKPFWYGHKVAYGKTGDKAERVGDFMDWILDNLRVTYACPKCDTQLDRDKDILQTDPPTATCPKCEFSGFLFKSFNVEGF
jgi:predicted RNA-binding Zn-ribbon protein involved in translation (DUF1610 family)